MDDKKDESKCMNRYSIELRVACLMTSEAKSVKMKRTNEGEGFFYIYIVCDFSNENARSD